MRAAVGVLALIASIVLCGAAAAQQQLPGIVVQGASVAVTPPKKATVSEAPSALAPASGSSQSNAQAPVATAAVSAAPSASATAANGAGEKAGASTAGQLLANQGTSVTVVTGSELRGQQIRHAADALRSLPGVSVNRTGGNAGLTQVRIRGAEGNHTLVMIDGVEVNTAADGEFDFSGLGTEEIERIEVLRGPQSGLYGSGAIGGVINVITRSGRGPLTVTARAETGGLSTKDSTVTASGGNDKVWGLVSLHTRHSHGYNISALGLEKDSNFISTFLAKGGFAVNENLQFSGMVRRMEKKGDRDDENFSVPVGALVPQKDTPSRFTSLGWTGYGEAKLTLDDGRWVSSFRAERNSLVNDDIAISDFVGFPFMAYDKYRSETERVKLASTYRIDTSALPHVRHFITGLYERTADSFIVVTDDNEPHTRSRKGFVGEIKGEYFDHLFLAASIRRDETDSFGDFTTWRTSASAKVPATPFRLHTSTGTGVRLPALFEQYGRVPMFFAPNPNLKAETSDGWDAGVEVSLFSGKLVMDGTYFDNELRDQIVRKSGFPASVQNLEGASTRQGWELTARVEPLPGLKFGAAYTRLNAREATGLREERRPVDSGMADVSYAFAGSRGLVSLAARYNGELIDGAALQRTGLFSFRNVRVNLDDYWLLTAAASYKVLPQIEIFGRVENVLDKHYQEVYGFEAAPIAAYAGVKITFEDPSTAGWAKYK